MKAQCGTVAFAQLCPSAPARLRAEPCLHAIEARSLGAGKRPQVPPEVASTAM